MDGFHWPLEALGDGIIDGSRIVEVYFLLQERVREGGVHVTYVFYEKRHHSLAYV